MHGHTNVQFLDSVLSDCSAALLKSVGEFVSVLPIFFINSMRFVKGYLNLMPFSVVRFVRIGVVSVGLC